MSTRIVASTAVSVFPTFKGLRGKIVKSAEREGREFGKRLSAAMSKEAKAPADLLKPLRSQRASAARELSEAHLKQADAAAVVAIAEKRLQEVLAKSGEGSSQHMRAVLNLEKAQRKLAAAQEALALSGKKLAAVDEELEKATAGATREAHSLHKAIASVMSGVVRTARGAVKEFSDGFKLKKAVEGQTPGVLRASGELARALFAPLVSLFPKLADRIPLVFLNAGASVRSFSSMLKGEISNAVNLVKGKLVDFGSALMKPFKPITSAVSGYLAPIGRALSNLGSALAPHVSGVLSHAAALGHAMGEKIAGGLRSAQSAVGAAATAVMGVIASNMHGAIQRVDILNNYPKVMRNLGYSADEARASLEKMNKGILGMPTSLSEIASMSQQLAPITSSLDEASSLAVALNNAFLAGGKGPVEAARAMTQYTQMLGKGSVDMQSWKIMQEVLPGQLNQLAKSLLGPTANSMTLYAAMKSGKISMQDFNKEVLKLNEQGLPGFASFAQQAKDATAGIETGFTNVGTAIKRNIANVINEIGAEKFSDVLAGIGSVIDKIGAKVRDFFHALKEGGAAAAGINPLTGALAAFAGGGLLASVSSVLGPLAGLIPGLGTAISVLTGPVGILAGAFLGLVAYSKPLQESLSGMAVTLRDSLGVALGEIQKGVAPLVPAFRGLADGLANMFSTTLNTLRPFISLLVIKVGQFIGGMLPKVTPIIDAITATVNTLTPVLSSIAQTLMSALFTAFDALSPIIGTVIDAVVGLVSILGPLISAAGEMINLILPHLIDLFSWVAPPVMFLASLMAGSLMTAIDGLKQFISGLCDFVVGVFTGNWSRAWEGIKGIFFGFITGMKGFVQLLLEYLLGIPAAVIGMFAGAAGWLRDAGFNIISGLWEGMKRAFQAVKDWVMGIGKWIADHKGPKSYDLALLVPAGGWIMQGLSTGLRKGIPQLRQTLEEVSSNISVNPPASALQVSAAYNTGAASGPVPLVLQVGDEKFNAYVDRRALLQAASSNQKTANETALYRR